MDIKVGMRLPNGAMVLAHKKCKQGLGERPDLHIVLCDNDPDGPTGYSQRYVTWLCQSEDCACSAGIYRFAIEDAAKDFKDRG